MEQADHDLLNRLDERLRNGFDGINERLDKLNGKTQKNCDDLAATNLKVNTLEAMFKFKSGLWGAIGAAIPTTGAAIWWLLK